jgi:GTP cyclohydrolase IA
MQTERPRSTLRTVSDFPQTEGRIRDLLAALGEEPGRPGLLDTPRRVRESLAFLTEGYEQDPREVLGTAIFAEQYDEMVLVKDIELWSMCEHHLVPFTGVAHVGYIPNESGKITGLSKLARLVDVYARRLQTQEHMTSQVATAIDEILKPRGVAVMLEAEHMCMSLRGVEKLGSLTVTTHFTGTFRDDVNEQVRFMTMLRGSQR